MLFNGGAHNVLEGTNGKDSGIVLRGFFLNIRKSTSFAQKKLNIIKMISLEKEDSK